MFACTAIEVVIAKNGDNWSDTTELLEKAGKAVKAGVAIDFIETVDDVAGYDNVIWFLRCCKIYNTL